MKSIIRNIYFFLYSLFLSYSKTAVRIAPSAHVKLTGRMGKCVKINHKAYLNGSIGNYSYIGSHSHIFADIGNFCSIGNNVKVIPSSHPLSYVSTSPATYSTAGQTVRTLVKNDTYKDTMFVAGTNTICCIGNDVWIGDNVLIKGGVSISDGAVVAMGAVVVNDVPPYAIVGGCPAKILKYRFPGNIIEQLLEIKWWEKDKEWLKNHIEKFNNVGSFIEIVCQDKNLRTQQGIKDENL